MATWEKGPIKVDYEINAEKKEITVTVFLQAIKVGGGTLTAERPSLNVEVINAENAKASITLRADFDNKELVIIGKACVKTIANGWNCTEYDHIIATW